jgi:hypothetical protein
VAAAIIRHNKEVSSMSEAGGTNIQLAHHLSHSHEPSKRLFNQILEFIEATVLAIVAIATAWVGYQAALWSGHQTELYGEASKLRVQADSEKTRANQERLYAAFNVV